MPQGRDAAGRFTAGAAFVEIGSDLAPLVKGLKTAQRKLVGFTKNVATIAGKMAAVMKRAFAVIVRAVGAAVHAVKKLGAVIGRVMRSVFNVVRSTARRAFQALAASIIAATYEAAQFEAAMAEVWSITSLTEKQLRAAGVAIRDLSVRYGSTGDRMARALYQTISAGITNVGEAMRLLDVAAKAAVAGVSETFQAVDVLTTIINSYGLAASDAERISDLLFVTVREGKTTFDQLASSVGRVAAVAATAGVEFEEIAAAIATLTKGGLSTEAAVTALRQTILSIISPTAEAQKLARQLGLQFNAAALRAKGLRGVLWDVRKAAGGNVEVLSTLFGNIRAYVAVASLAGAQSAEFDLQLVKMKKSAGATEAAYLKLSQTLSFAFRQLWAALRGLFGAVGDVIQPYIKTWTRSIVKWLSNAAKWVRQNSQTIRKHIDRALQWVARAWGWLKGQLRGLYEGLKADHDSLWEAVKSKANDFWAWLETKWKSDWKPLVEEAFKALRLIMEGQWEEGFTKLGSITAAFIDDFIEFLRDETPRFVDAAMGFVDGFLTKFEEEDTGAKFVKLGMDIINRLIKGMRDKKTLEKIKAIFGDMWDQFRASVEENRALIVDTAADIGKMLAEGIRNALLDAMPEWLLDWAAGRERVWYGQARPGLPHPPRGPEDIIAESPEVGLAGTNPKSHYPPGGAFGPEGGGAVNITNNFLPVGPESARQMSRQIELRQYRGR